MTKIKGPNSTSPIPGNVDESASAKKKTSSFAEVLSQKSDATKESGEASPIQKLVQELSKEIEAGRLNPDDAVSKIIDNVISVQGAHLAGPAKEGLRKALEDMLEQDPTLKESLAALKEKE